MLRCNAMICADRRGFPHNLAFLDFGFEIKASGDTLCEVTRP